MGPAERLAARIAQSGPVPFAEFMDEALYGEGGYYADPVLRIGASGDFVTGSSLSPAFGATTERLLRRLDEELGEPAVLFEPGVGGGEHARAVRAASGGRRRVLVHDRVRRPLGEGLDWVESPDDLESRSLDGLVFSYELFDALPVHRLIGREDGRLGELWVDHDGHRFSWKESGLSEPDLAGLLAGETLAPGQIADLSPGWEPLYESLAARVGRGLIVTCDYGFERRQLLDARVRLHGTLACYREQTVHRDPFREVGRQDLTAHVDWSRLIAAGERLGLQTVALTRQALWLVANGFFESLAEAGVAQRADAARLLDGQGMGEDIRVLVQARGIDPWRVLDRELLLPGFSPS